MNYLLSLSPSSCVTFSVSVGLGTTIYSHLHSSGMMSSDASPCHYQPPCVMELESLLCPLGDKHLSGSASCRSALLPLSLPPLFVGLLEPFFVSCVSDEAAEHGDLATPLQVAGGIAALLIYVRDWEVPVRSDPETGFLSHGRNI